MMNLDNLVEKIHESNSEISKKDIKAIVKSCFENIQNEVVADNEVTIHGFGVFTHVDVPERTYKCNEKIGMKEDVVKPAHKKAKFKPFKTLSNF